MQVVDDDKGPSTKREYETARVPAGEAVTGKVIDFLGRPPGSQVQLGTNVMVPLLGEQPDMESREQIAESLLTGVKVRHPPG
jgi:flagellar biosynthesis/type III secretory pathway ATPase